MCFKSGKKYTGVFLTHNMAKIIITVHLENRLASLMPVPDFAAGIAFVKK